MSLDANKLLLNAETPGAHPRPELKWIKAKELKGHPQNWRFHPDSQRRALGGLLKTVGWAGVILMNQTTGRIIDGHLRRSLVDEEEEVPVLVGSWTEQEERLILATLDPIASEAESDKMLYRQLTEDIQSESNDLNALIDDLRGYEPKVSQESDGEEPSMESALALRPKEHYDYLIVLAQSQDEWNQLCHLLGLSTKSRGVSKLGFGRGIRASALIELLTLKAV